MKILHPFVALLLVLCSTLSFPAGAAVIKNVQTGTITMNPATRTVAITSVSTAKTFVVCQGDSGAAGSNPTLRPTCELTNATTLTITTSVADAAITVRWYVVEFWSGVTVQRGLVPTGTFTAGQATVNVAIAAVNLAKTFVLITERANTATQTIDEQWTTRAQLTTTTNLQITRIETGVALAVAWQVIQIESSLVQSGTTTIANNSATATAALAPPIDVDRTFVVFSLNGNTGIGGDETLYRVTGRITNATTLSFQRSRNPGGGNTQINITWFAVRMTDGTRVQRNVCGPSGTGAGSATMPATPAGCLTLNNPVIVVNRSVAFISARGDDLGSTSLTADLDDSSWKSTLATNAITLTRSTGASLSENSNVAWEVVQFNNAPNVVDGDGREVFP